MSLDRINIEQVILDAVRETIGKIVEEEASAAAERVKKRIAENAAKIGVAIIPNLSYDGAGKITIEVNPNVPKFR